MIDFDLCFQFTLSVYGIKTTLGFKTYCVAVNTRENNSDGIRVCERIEWAGREGCITAVLEYWMKCL